MKKFNKYPDDNGLISSNSKGQMLFDELDVTTFVETRNTPLYLFSEKKIGENFGHLQRAFGKWDPKKLKIAYSIKNNSIPQIVRIIQKKDGMFEVTSEGEMQLLHKLGVPLSKCIYTNIWKPPSSIKYAIRNKLGFFAIDSLSDMKNISEVARELQQKVRVLIRVNPAIDIRDSVFASAVPWSKTGVEIVQGYDEINKGNDAATLLEKSIRESNLIVSGIHGHLGSQITDINYYDDFTKKISDFYLYVEDNFGIKLDVIDFGGGYPVNYGNGKTMSSIEDITGTIISNLDSAGIDANLIVESGRYITGNAGILITKIVSVKQSHTVGKIAVTDASAYNELLDSVLVHWYFDMMIANKMDKPKDDIVKVVGSTTDSIDVFDPLKENVCPECQEVIEKRRNRLLQRVEEGDILAILGAGAYTTCFNMNYCLRPKPSIYLIRSNGKTIRIRREEKLDDILACCKMPKRAIG